MLQVDLKTIHNWVKQGHILGRRTKGRHLRFRRTEVVHFLRHSGHDVPSFICTAPVRVLVSRPRGVRGKPFSLGRGIAQSGCEGLFAAAIELATGYHEILVVDLDLHGLRCVLDMMDALRCRDDTCSIPMIGLSQKPAFRKDFIAQGGDAALVLRAVELAATIRWMAGGPTAPPAPVALRQ